MEVKLKDGTVITGTPEQVSRVIKVMGEEDASGKYYHSASKGTVLIADMHDFHLRNAICKLYRDWTAQLNTKPIKEFLNLIKVGPSTPTILAMVEELGTRAKDGRLKS